MDTDFCPQGKGKLVARYVKCLSPGMDYVEKQWAGNTIKSELFLKFNIKYPTFQEEMLIFWEVTVSVIFRKNVHTNICLILN